MRFYLIPLVVLAACLTLASCETMNTQSKENISTAVGAVAGAILGGKLGGNSKALGILIGGIGGALIGKVIGHMLDEHDQQQLTASTYKSLQTSQPQSWHNPNTGVTAKTSIKKTMTEHKNVQVKILKDKVKTLPPMNFIGEEYSANNSLNVRAGPGTDYRVVDKLGTGEHVKVVGQVIGKPWYMISKNGVGSGFVYTSLLTAIPVENQPAPQSAPSVPLPPSQVESATVSATSDCKVVTQEVTLNNGKTATEDVTACRGPNGWQIV